MFQVECSISGSIRDEHSGVRPERRSAAAGQTGELLPVSFLLVKFVLYLFMQHVLHFNQGTKLPSVVIKMLHL